MPRRPTIPPLVRTRLSLELSPEDKAELVAYQSEAGLPTITAAVRDSVRVSRRVVELKQEGSLILEKWDRDTKEYIHEEVTDL